MSPARILTQIASLLSEPEDWIWACLFLSIDRTNYREKYQDRVTLATDTMSITCYIVLSRTTFEDSDISYCVRHRVTVHI